MDPHALYREEATRRGLLPRRGPAPLGLAEVARRAGLSLSGVQYLVKTGRLPVVRGSGRYRWRWEVPAADAERLVESRKALRARGLRRPRRLSPHSMGTP